MTRAMIVLGLIAIAHTARADVVSSGTLQMRTRHDLVIGVDAEAAIELAPGAERLIASAGSVALAADGQHAVLKLPTTRYPQVIIVAALEARGVVLDWLAIPLSGQAVVKVATSPRASVIVRIADRATATVRADRRGIANVPVVVGPGITNALAIATSAGGNVTEKPVELNARDFVRAFSICREHHVTILAVDATGRPATVPPRVALSNGTIGTLTSRDPGRFEADAAIARESQVTAEDGGSSSCLLVAPPQAPTTISMRVSRDRFVAGEGPIDLAIAVEYPGQARHLAPELAVTTDAGTVAFDGTHGVWSLPAQLAGKQVAHARVIASWPGGRLEREVAVAMHPAGAADLAIDPVATLVADGAAVTDVVARVVDRYGNPVRVPVSGRARGSLGRFVARADGRYVAHYTPPLQRSAGDDRIVVEANGITRQVVAPLQPLPPRFAATASAGVISNFGRLTAPLVLVGGDARLPPWHERIAIGVAAGAYRGTFQTSAMGEEITGSLTAIPLLARVQWRETRRDVDLWIGAGAGAAFLTSRLESASIGSAIAHATRPAALAFAGASYRLGHVSLGLEVGYLHATLSAGEPVHGQAGGATAAITARLE